jgi:hypothetical protein
VSQQTHPVPNLNQFEKEDSDEIRIWIHAEFRPP